MSARTRQDGRHADYRIRSYIFVQQLVGKMVFYYFIIKDIMHFDSQEYIRVYMKPKHLSLYKTFFVFKGTNFTENYNKKTQLLKFIIERLYKNIYIQSRKSYSTAL